jgi:ribosome-associated translation inhibitor RaiA
MYVPTINIRTTNVELTSGRRALIIRKLTPLGRLLQADEAGQFDVVLRRERHRFGGTKYYLSVKLCSGGDVYHAVAIEPRLEKALSKTRDILKRALKKSDVHSEYALRSDRMHVIDHYQLLLGNH